MPLRTSSHPGSPNCPSCSALAWYSCWPGLSPWGESWKRTRVARTAALTRYRYATQPTGESNYVLNEHEDFDQYCSLAIPSEIMPCKSYPESLNQYEILIKLLCSSGTNYVPNKHEDVDQYDPYAIPSNIMPCWSYPESLVNQNEIPVDLLC